MKSDRPKVAQVQILILFSNLNFLKLSCTEVANSECPNSTRPGHILEKSQLITLKNDSDGFFFLSKHSLPY